MRLKEVTYDKKKHKIFWLTTVDELTDNSDVVIVATHSSGRVNLIKKLLKSNHKRFLIEKFVCQSVAEYKTLLLYMKKFKAKGWVNANLQCFNGYQKIKESLKPRESISLSVFTNSKYGLATQSIHYLSLFSWLTENKKFTLDGRYLKKKLILNKRSAFFKEFQGTLIGSNNDGSFLKLTFLPSIGNALIIKISGENIHFIIDELNNKISVFNEKKSKKWNFEFEHVSSLTTKIVHDIFRKDNCSLPSVQDSLYPHSELFRVFNLHLKKIFNKDFKLCPVT